MSYTMVIECFIYKIERQYKVLNKYSRLEKYSSCILDILQYNSSDMISNNDIPNTHNKNNNVPYHNTVLEDVDYPSHEMFSSHPVIQDKSQSFFNHIFAKPQIQILI